MESAAAGRRFRTGAGRGRTATPVLRAAAVRVEERVQLGFGAPLDVLRHRTMTVRAHAQICGDRHEEQLRQPHLDGYAEHASCVEVVEHRITQFRGRAPGPRAAAARSDCTWGSTIMNTWPGLMAVASAGLLARRQTPRSCDTGHLRTCGTRSRRPSPLGRAIAAAAPRVTSRPPQSGRRGPLPPPRDFALARHTGSMP